MKINYILLLILLAALILRFLGIYPGYDAYHSDEPIIWGSVVEMISNHTLDPGRYDYPPVPMYINYVAYHLFFIPLAWLIFYSQRIPQLVDGLVQLNMAPLEAHRTFHTFILGARGINAMYWSRYITALFSLGNVLLTYILGKKLVSKQVGLIAALFVAFNFRQVLNAHISLPDVYNAFFLLLSLLTLVKLWKDPRKFNYLLTGIILGIYFSTKYQIFPLVSLAVVHGFVNLENRKPVWQWLNSKLIIAGLAFLAAIMFLNPYFFINLDRALYWVTSVSSKYGFGVYKLNLYPISYLYHFDWGPIETLLFLAGILLGLKKYFRQTIFLLSVIVPFFFVFFYYSTGGFYTRNFITITPLVLLIAATGISALKLPNFILVPLLAAALFIPGKNAIISSYYYTKDWNYRQLSKWLYENIPPGTTVGSHPFDPPTGSPVLKKTEFEISGSYSMAEHIENGAEYAIINTGWAGNPFYGWMNYGLSDQKLLWNKPTQLLRNTFHGMAIEEMLNYRIFAVSKPWQSPDNGLIVVKFPHWPEIKFNQVKKYDFDTSLEGWSTLKQVPSSVDYIFDKGSIKFISGGAKFPIIRAVSMIVEIKGGHVYKISGHLKASKALGSRERDGFIRANFFKDQNFDSAGLQSAVSSRVWGPIEWSKKIIVTRAPDEAKFLRIGFQVDNIASDTSFWLNDVTVEESDGYVDDPTKDKPYVKDQVYPDLLYPNSHGNL